MKKQQNVNKTVFWKYSLSDSDAINHRLLTEFNLLKATESANKTHYFNGRYENIYISELDIPTVTPVLQTACNYALDILSISDPLTVGFWFNLMEPGNTTIRHRHDDDDELLSAVYYVKTMKNSGELVIYNNDEKFNVVPQEGTFVFFKSDTEHEVLENQSDSSRLSIGMNFGIKIESPSYVK